jgi:hypothetical protein
MKNVTFDRTTVLQLDVDSSDSALDAAADCHILRNDVALDLCAIADQEFRGAQLALDSAEDLHWTIAFDVPDDRHVRADTRRRSRFCRRLGSRPGLVMRLHRPPDDFGRTLILLGCPALHGIQHVHLRFCRHAPQKQSSSRSSTN